MGPFEIGDIMGLDVTRGALMSIYEVNKHPYRYPPVMLRQKVKTGHLGRKAGKGWYGYHGDGTEETGD